MTPRAGTLVALALVCALAPGRADALITLTGPQGMDWDLNDTGGGTIGDGETDTYDTCYYLSVNSTQYSAGGIAGIDTGGHVELASHTIGDLVVQRFVYVPTTGTYDFLRYYDTISNPTSGIVHATATYSGNLGSDSSTILVADSDGDTVADTDDTWIVTNDSGSYDTPVAHLWWDGIGLAPTTLSRSSDNLTTTFEFDVPPMSIVALMIFAVQMPTRADAQAGAEWLVTMPDEAITGLTSDEMRRILNWQAGGAPVIRVVTDPLEVGEGRTLTLEVEVEDLEGDPYTVAWDLDGDGAFDDGTGETAILDAAGLDGPTSLLVGVEATDGTESRDVTIGVEVLNVPPEFLSDPAVDPGLTLHRGIAWSYTIEVEDPANVTGTTLDPVQVQVTTKPDGMIYFGDGRLEWTPPMSPAAVGDHEVVIEADDFDGDPAVQEFTLTVLDNAPPDPPVIVSPMESTVWDRRPTLVVENAHDVDGDSLTYTFQVDMTGEFLPGGLVTAGNLVENPSGQTSWTVNTDLMDGNRYYWRAWANDGSQDGDPSSTWFDVDLSAVPDETPDDPADGSTDAPTDIDPGEFVPTPSDDLGCGCETVPGSAGGWPALLVLVAVVGLAARFRGVRGGTR